MSDFPRTPIRVVLRQAQVYEAFKVGPLYDVYSEPFVPYATGVSEQAFADQFIAEHDASELARLRAALRAALREAEAQLVQDDLPDVIINVLNAAEDWEDEPNPENSITLSDAVQVYRNISRAAPAPEGAPDHG